ncbi:MAG: DJ-1/PfpI family protein [Candidatus Thorarchaeota archaeon]
MSKISIIFIFTCIIPLLVCNGFNTHSQAVIQDPNNIKILSLIADGVGNTYFTVKNQFEEWGWNFTTAGLEENHTGCPNKDPIIITSDILISAIENISQYDCIFIASGAQHHILREDPSVLNLIKKGYNEGLVISTLCVSTVILADADIIKGIKVVGDPLYYYDIKEAGGIFDAHAKVISDKRIITGGKGGGPTGGGDLSAPTYELCTAIAKELLGFSYVINTYLNPVTGSSNTIFFISVETTNLTDLPFDINSSEISQINAIIDKKFSNNLTLIEDLELVNANGIYQGHFSKMNVGEYVITIEVKNMDDCIEIVRNTVTFSIESPESSSTSILTSSNTQTKTSESSVGLTCISSLILILYLIVYRKKRDKRSCD